MVTKYDTYWRNRLGVVVELLAEAAQKGASRALDVSDLREIGRRQNWSSVAYLSPDGLLQGNKTYTRSLGRIAFDNGLMESYGDMVFRLTISKDLRLTIRQEETTKWGKSPPLPELPQPEVVKKHPTIITAITDLPGVPAVYAMYGGQERGLYVAYVGVGGNLRRRIERHLVRHSNITASTSAVMLNANHVTEVRWWTHPDFAKRDVLEAAELVAFDVLEPILRSRGKTRETSAQLYVTPEFAAQMRSLLTGEPAGRLVIQTLEDALERIAALERRLADLEKRLV